MLRPIYLDLLDVIVPLCAGAVTFACGRQLHRVPRPIARTIVGLAVLVVLILGISYFLPFPEPIYDVLWHVGGEAIIASVLAVFLLGVVWGVRGRSTSTGFLGVLVALVALIIVLSTGGRLWWRTFSQATWENAPNANGCLTQTTGWTCSPATATMLLHHYGVATTEGEMAYLANTSYLGTDVRSIAHALQIKGEPHRLQPQVVFGNYEACLDQKTPFLACVRIPGLGGHAVLVLRMSPDKVELIDPRYGRRETVVRSEIEPQWEGRIVRLEVAE